MYLTKAIRKLKPNAEFSFNDEDYSTINWVILEGTPPTQQQIDAEIANIKIAEQEEITNKAIAKAAVLERLGITADEAALLLS